MPKPRSMSSPWKKQPDAVVDKVLKRAEVSKMALRLQNRLALAQFKTKHGWEDLTLDSIEPKFEKELRRQRLFAVADAGGNNQADVFSDSSSSGSDRHQRRHHLPSYPNARVNGLMSSPLKAPLFSDAIHGSGGSIHGRKRTHMQTFDGLPLLLSASSPSKRFRPSSGAHTTNGTSTNGNRSFGGTTNGNATRSFANGSGGSRGGGHTVGWKDTHQLAQSSPVRHHQPLLPRTSTAATPTTTTATATLGSLLDGPHARHFTTHAGPDVSFFAASSSRRNRRNARLDSSPAYAPAHSDDENDGVHGTAAAVAGGGGVDDGDDSRSSAATDTTHVGDAGPDAHDDGPDEGATGHDGYGVVATADILRSSPPRTPPMHLMRRPTGRGATGRGAGGAAAAAAGPTANNSNGRLTAPPTDRQRSHNNNNQTDAGNVTDEGADLLIFLKTTPSPAVRVPRRGSGMFGAEPSTPPSRVTRSGGGGTGTGTGANFDLPSSMLNTPGPPGLLGFPNTPGQAFDFADFVNITPSPAQKPWKTPVTGAGGRTPRSIARRMLTFD